MKPIKQFVKKASVISLSLLSPFAFAASYDTVILNGRVIDPETKFDAIANIGIKDNQIVTITTDAISGDKTIDATGKVVAPGFIDVHAHGQNIGDYRMQAMQGVTTMLELESGVLPISSWYDEQGKKGLPLNYGAAAGWTYARIATFSGTQPEATADYFQKAQSRNDWKMDIATPEQQEKILKLIEQGLDEGGLGIGINAGYAPGHGQKEYYALAELAAQRDVATYTHVRYASNAEPQSSFEAVKELIGNAAITGAHMHLCHINSTSLKDIDTILPMVEKAKEQGINVTVGAYPYGAASTVVGAAMFQGEGWRERMGSTAENFQLGKERMSEKQLADYQANNPGTFIVWHFLDENNPEDLAKLDASILSPDVLIESDEMFWMHMDEEGHVDNYAGDEWPLPKDLFSHPRSNGTFAKVLRMYVRERGLLSMSEAIRKMTLMPAQLLEDFVPQMKNKGRIQPNMDADIVVFDPETISDVGTYQDPNHPAVGVHWLLVNGEIVVNNSELDTTVKAGKAIRRTEK
ncbi:amidohydrolase family protein [Vibrio vulnificus]|uniref:amidohydrolase family protein n=1 Tax=Vibrio vulnificus TaxID=672 RepID=UPI001CDD2FE5|nr:amidohydrolase family protein [Vibrio vulnificus]ELV8710420.1 amidohydrolase family protein [Vibrio vulnificus]MCA3980675.1 amidohydrolase family protein [Vibrio vulnificus]MCR9500776.1 amidohydrolase family protein [Vibrio vulnificus]MCU8388342.1 amidohydrolase family protein [Vibrio vulnificus]MCU8545435.1 amidohydrolase family protein [Vibrio vulnificus]